MYLQCYLKNLRAHTNNSSSITTKSHAYFYFISQNIVSLLSIETFLVHLIPEIIFVSHSSGKYIFKKISTKKFLYRKSWLLIYKPQNVNNLHMTRVREKQNVKIFFSFFVCDILV